MSVAGAVAAAIRNTNSYSNLFSEGARFVVDFIGAKTGKPFYGLNNRVYSNIQSIPGYNFSRASEALAEGLVNDVVLNKVTCWNANPTEAAGFVGNPVNMTKSGDAAAVLSVVDDSAALAIAGLSGVCTSGKVYKLDNTLGVGLAYATFLGDTTNTNPHTGSCYIRGGSGIIQSSGGSPNAAVAASAVYVRRVLAFTPVSGTQRLTVGASAGQTIYFILPQLIERPAAIAQDIVTQGAAASAVVGRIDGLVSFASGVPAITSRGLSVWESRTNIVLRSQDITLSPWNGFQSTRAENTTLAPDGTMTADTVTLTAAVGNAYQGGITKPASSLTYTASVYVKIGQGTSFALRLYDAVGGNINKGEVGVNLSTGVATTAIATGTFSAPYARVDTLGNGWYRVNLTVTTGTETSLVFEALMTGATGNSFNIWQADLQLGAFATPPIVTAGAAATRAADNPYITGLGSILGGFRTNLAQYSSDVTNAQWTATGISKTSGQADPWGGTSAALIAGDGTGSGHFNSASDTTVPYTSGLVYTISRYLKAGTSTLGQLTGAGTAFGVNQYANFDLVAGTVTAQTGLTVPATIEAVPGFPGWWRASISVLATATIVAHGGVAALISTGTAGRAQSHTSSLDFYTTGAQVEVGSTMSAYIPTTTAAVTVGNPFTMVAWADLPAADGVDRTAMGARDAAVLNEYRLRRAGGNDTLITVTAGGVNQNITAVNGFTGARVIRWAARNRPTSTRLAVDNALRAETTLTNIPGPLDRIVLGYAGGGSSFLNGYLQRVAIYGDVTDIQLQRLTE